MVWRLMPIGLAILLIVSGIALTGGAVILAATGLVALELVTGPILIAAGVELLRGSRSALQLFIGYFLLVWISAILEGALDGWSLLPRVDFACVVLPLFFLPVVRKRLAPNGLSRWWQALPGYRRLAPLVVILSLTVALILANRPTAVPPLQARSAPVAASAASGDWLEFGGNPSANKFSALADITRDNAARLKPLWHYTEPAKLGGPAPSIRKDEATPLKIGDKIFVCTSDNVVFALDAETGLRVWRYDPETDETGVEAAICRGLAYAQRPEARVCPHRLLMGTLDARLIALDAETGRPCSDFGVNGAVNLLKGLGPVKQGYYYLTSPPTILNGVAVIGGIVRDNEETGEPSGVIRGYDTGSGQLLWAWDMGRPPSPATDPMAETPYTQGTPNAWTVFSADAKLGLVFVPMGNGTPDFVAQHRDPVWEPYASALVALDIKTGKLRWSFQTVHHDVWDNDLSAQPVLADLPTPSGAVPIVMIGTKRAQIFVLDRRNGRPVLPVEERPVPQTDIAGERTSPTQPLSVGMPDLGGHPLRDADMWGASPFDRMFCRIKLRQLRYEGPFTPPSLRGSLIYPGLAGGVDWGGMTFDPGRRMLMVPTMHLAQIVTLIKRGSGAAEGNAPQRGTPYSAKLQQFMTRLGIPCQRPPYAQLTAIDLNSRQIVWQRPIGTAEKIGPLGIASRLPLTIGAPPLIGGGVATAGDVTFIGAVGDRRLRAIDSLTGRELWSTPLPEGNQATPITYRAPRSHRQIVVMVSGSWADLGQSRNVPTHVVAYALDD